MARQPRCSSRATAPSWFRPAPPWRAIIIRGAGRLGGETTIASAATTDIGGASTLRVAVSGTAAITSFGTRPRSLRLVRFTGAATLTHGASLKLIGAASRTVAADAIGVYVSDDAGAWREVSYAAPSSALSTTELGLGDADGKFYRYDENDYRVMVAGADVLAIAATGVAITGALSVTGQTSLGGSVVLAASAVTQLTADTNALALPVGSILTLTSDAARTINGFVGPVSGRLRAR